MNIQMQVNENHTTYARRKKNVENPERFHVFFSPRLPELDWLKISGYRSHNSNGHACNWELLLVA